MEIRSDINVIMDTVAYKLDCICSAIRTIIGSLCAHLGQFSQNPTNLIIYTYYANSFLKKKQHIS